MSQQSTPEAAPAWRRLSPRKMLLDPVKALGSAVVPIVIAVVTVHQVWLSALFIVGGVLFAVIGGVYPYLTTRFRITDTHFEVRTGWLNRRISTAALTRIRSVDLEAPLLYRALAMEKITIRTGVDAEQVELDALVRDEAAALKRLLLTRPAGAPIPVVEDRSTGEPTAHAPVPDVQAPVDELAAFTPNWARYAPLHLTGFVLLLAGLGAVVSFVLGIPGVDARIVRDLWDWLTGFTVVTVGGTLLVVVLIAWLVLSLASYVTEWFGFRLWREAGSLHVTRGLLTTRAVSLEEQRIRGVQTTERLLVRMFGGAELSVQSSGEGASDAQVLPTAPRDVVERVAAQILGDPTPVTVRATPHPPGALRRRLGWGLWPAGAVAALTGAAALDWLPFAAGDWLHTHLSVPLGVALTTVAAGWGLTAGWSAYRHLGHAVTSRHLVRTSGIFSLRREVLELDGIIGWVVRQSVFQRRLGLATLVATTAAGEQHVDVPDLALADAWRVMATATPSTVAPFLAQ